MKKHIALIFAFLIFLVLSGCGTMMFLLGDNIRYSISGRVESSLVSGNRGVDGVLVAIDCPGVESSVYQDKNGVTDANGDYGLSGYWELHGCKIRFTHDRYNSQTVDIDKTHLIKSEGLSRAYRVDARLDPK